MSKKRNLVRQVIVLKDGSTKNIFHQKKFNGGSFKSWWDVLNKSPRPKSKRQLRLKQITP